MRSWFCLFILLFLFIIPPVIFGQNCNNWAKITSSKSGIQIGDLDITGDKVTVEATFNRTSPYSGSQLYAGDLVSKHSGPNTGNYLLRSNSAEVTTTNGYFKTPDICDIQLNKTYHVAMVYDGKELKFYRNGFLMSKIACTGNLYQNNFLTAIGTFSYNPNITNENLVGYINEVRIWNVARTQDDIKKYMNQSLPNLASQTGLLAYYTFDDLKNKQGNSQWDGSILGNASINQTNPTCSSFIADSCGIKTTNVIASFTASDTICKNTPLNITNTSTGATTYYWSFCQADLNQKPTGDNLGNINSAFSLPDYSDIVSQNGKYYVFVVNNYHGGLTRLDFGNSLLNTPSSVSLGNLGGAIEDQAEGIQVVNSNGHWYAIMVGGATIDGTTPQILKIDFGSDITNISPSVTDWGNIGNMEYPHKLFVFNKDNVWYGFTANYGNNTITRFDFGSDFANPPTAKNLGGFGILNGPTGINAIENNNRWYVFVTNAINSKITRLDFGNSLLNTPTAIDLGNLNGTMDECFDIYIQKYCDDILGFVVNGDDNYNDIVRLDFNNDLTSVPSAISLGNIGKLSFPHSFSKLFRVENDLYSMIPNAHNNTLTRIKFAGCNNSSIPNTTQFNPPQITYDSAGVYNISLSVDEGLPTQTSYCKQIVVKNCDTCNLKTDFSYRQNTCDPKTIQFQNKTLNADSIWWDFGDGQTADSTQNPIHQYAGFGNYIVNLYSKTNAGCLDTATDTIAVAIKKDSAIITNDSSICAGGSVQLNAINGLNYCWSPAGSLSDSSIQNPVASPVVTTTYYLNILTANNKPVIQDSVTITIVQPPMVNAGKDTSVCKGSAIQLNASGANTYNWNASVLLSDTTIANPFAAPINSTNFIVTGYNASGCFDTDTIKVSVLPLPVFTLTNDTAICKGSSIMLQAKATGNNNFTWSPSTGLSDPNIFNPVANPADTTKYFVSVTDSNNCIAVDSVIVDVLNTPVVSAINDTSICEGSSITLQTNASYASVFKWTPKNGLNNPDIKSPDASPLTSTLYTVTADNGICSAKDSVLISILSLPVVVANNDTTVCGNSSAQLYAAGAVSYSWNPVKGLSDPKVYNPVAAPGSTTKYYVTGTGNNSCTNIDSVTVTVQPAPAFSISPKNIALCKGDSVKLTASGGDTYLWLPSETVTDSLAPVTKVFPFVSTTYRVIITNTACKFTDSLKSNVTVEDVPAVTITKSNDIDCLNFEAQLVASGGMSYQWFPSTYISNTHIANPVVYPPVDTKYIVVAKNEYSCKTRDSILVQSNTLNTDAAKFEIANAFTPNHDGLNDCFSVKYWGPADFFDISIYDRWGYLVYHSNNINSCWDGTIRGVPQASGTYVYKISVSSKCSNGMLHKKGTVVLMR